MLLELQHVSKTYRGRGKEVRALDDVSLSVARGEFVGIRGPSGGGKSTLLLVAGALLSPDRGRVLIDGTDPYALSPNERARFRSASLGFVFQQFHLVPYLSVLENVLAAAVPLADKDARDRARELIARFGLEHRAHHVPGQLSTGERQRTALARALLNRPKLILADEPTGNIDPENAEIVLRSLAEFAREGAVLLVSHDSRALEYAERTAFLQSGALDPSPPPAGVPEHRLQDASPPSP